MPAAAGAVVGWLGLTGVAATVVGTIVQIGTVLAINTGLSKLSQLLAGKPKAPDFGPRSREVTIKGTVEPRQLIYGQVRTGGFIAFAGTSGSEGQYLHFVVVYAGHECTEIGDIWLDSRKIESADINPSTGAVSTLAFVGPAAAPKLHIWKHLGEATQVVDSTLDAAFTEWTTDHKGYGVCYAHFRMEKDEKVWATGAPSSYFALVKGRKLYDARKDSTNGGSGSHRTNNPSTWEWNDCWALCARDYVSGGALVYANTTPDKRLGVGEDDSRIDDTYTIAAANISDEDVLIPPASPTTTQKRYTCNLQLSCGAIHRENLETLLAAGAGKLSYVDGRYRIYAGAYDAPTVSLTADDVLGPIEVSTHPPGEDSYNFVSGEFMDPDRDWTVNPFPAQKNSTYETDDGGQRARFVQLHAVTNNYRAQRIGRLHLEQSRNKTYVKFTALSPKAILVGEWETFDVTIPEYGWNAQVFRALDIEDLPSGLMAITARIEGSQQYDDPDVADYTDPGTNLPPSYNVETAPAVSSFAATSARDGIFFTWLHSGRTGSRYAIYEHTSSTPFSSAVKIWEGNANYALIEKRDLTTRYYWITHSLSGLESTEAPSGAGTAGAAATLTQWIARGTCIAGGSTARKQSGTTTWGEADCYSIDSYSSCHVKFKPGQTNGSVLAGLAIAPASTLSYTNIDYGWHAESNGTLDIYESGTPVLTDISGGYGTSTELLITYDGSTVRYYRNRVLVRSVGDSGKTFYGKAAFLHVGALISSFKFGPTINPDLVDTADLGSNAATVVTSVTDDSVSLTNGGGVVLSANLTPIGINYLLQVTATLDVWITNNGGGTPTFQIEVNGNSTLLGNSQVSVPSATTSPGQRIALQTEIPIIPADEVSLMAQVTWTGAQPSGTAEARNVSIRAEGIKR